MKNNKDINEEQKFQNAMDGSALQGIDINAFISSATDWWKTRKENKTAAAQQAAAEAAAQQAALETEAKAKQQKTLIIGGIVGVGLIGAIIITVIILKPKK